MNELPKGGNGRLLAKLLDQLGCGCAVLDRHGEIIFVNSTVCQLAGIEAAGLVGKKCSWSLAADGPLASLLTALAPPQGALDGRLVLRQLTAPIFFESEDDGQLFLPLVDLSGVTHMTLVLFGDFLRLRSLLDWDRFSLETNTPDRVLVQLRSRWAKLNDLSILLGESPAISLAMRRAQMAIKHPCDMIIHGPSGVGKHDLAQAIFLGRMNQASLHLGTGQCFPVDCRRLDHQVLTSMIEIFASRLQADSRPISSQLILNGVDRLSADAVPEVLNWLQRLEGKCMTTATSSLAAQAIAQRGPDWSRLIGRVSSIEIGLPGLVERREDIGPLALEALAQACAKADRAQLALSNEALGYLQVYDWPGNTRQLFAAMREAVSQAVLVSAIQPSHLPLSIRTFPTSKTQANDRLSLQPIDLDQVLLELERTIIRRALMANPRNRAKAARQLGISRPRLLRRIEQLGLQEYSPTLTEDADDESESN